jgi:hypothetical protein
MIIQKNRLIDQLKNGVFTPEAAAEPALWLEAALVSGGPDLSAPRPPARSPKKAKELRKPGGFLWVRIEYTLPFFFAALIALNLCALISLRGFTVFQAPPAPPPPVLEEPEAALPELFEGLSPAFLQEPEPVQDPISGYYRDPLSRDLVIDFFSRITGSREIAELILAAGDSRKVPPALAFAVAWEESRYRPKAVNTHNRNGSIDRGLFQLNSRSFPKLNETDFFDPRINARYGIAHLRWCLDTGGSETVALAIYNAGAVRVNTNGAPKTTLGYVERVLNSRRKIDGFFKAEIARLNGEIPGAQPAPAGEAAPEPKEEPHP